MTDIINWIETNVTWIFSGIGVFIIGIFVYRNKKQKKNKQIIKNKSSGIQAGGDIKINKK